MLQDIISPYKAEFVHYTELRVQVNSEYTLELNYQGSCAESSVQKGGVSARVFENGAFGFAASCLYDDFSVRRVLETAKRNARALGSYVRKNRAIPDISCGSIPINYEVENMDSTFLRSAAEEMKRYAESHYAPVKAKITFNNRMSEKLLVVKNGFDGRSNIVLGDIIVELERQGGDGSPVFTWERKSIDTYLMTALDRDSLYDLVDQAYEKLTKRLSDEKVEKAIPDSGICECILSPEFTGMLAHEAVGHTCEADAVVEKDSVAAAYMGKQVASELVSLTDFAYEAYGEKCPISLHVDDEGVKCTDAEIIKDGMLVGCMTNRILAAQLGIENTGNARASEYNDEPIIRMRNTCFLPGSSTLEDMISSIKHGYYLTRSGGGNGSLKGEFSMSVEEGFEINNGKLGRPIRNTICSGVAWDALKTVDMISSNFDNPKNCGMCGKKQMIPTSQGGPEMKIRLRLGG